MTSSNKNPEISDSCSHEDEPFMEHPTGEFDTALQAIHSAMQRLSQIDMGDRWITFCGQCQGATPELIKDVSIPFCGCTFDLSEISINVEQLLDSAGVAFEKNPNNFISLPHASSEELAKLLDAVLQQALAFKPNDDEEDYAVGAEW